MSRVPLLKVPVWGQRIDPGPDGRMDAFSETDCGEECLSMVLEACKGLYTTEGQVRAALPGHQDHGETSEIDLVGYLQGQGLPATVRWVAPMALEPALKKVIAAGRPPIILGNFLAPGVLHWVVGRGFGNGRLYVNEPYFGTVDGWTWDWLRTVYANRFVDPGAKAQGAVIYTPSI